MALASELTLPKIQEEKVADDSSSLLTDENSRIVTPDLQTTLPQIAADEDGDDPKGKTSPTFNMKQKMTVDVKNPSQLPPLQQDEEEKNSSSMTLNTRVTPKPQRATPNDEPGSPTTANSRPSRLELEPTNKQF